MVQAWDPLLKLCGGAGAYCRATLKRIFPGLTMMIKGPRLIQGLQVGSGAKSRPLSRANGGGIP